MLSKTFILQSSVKRDMLIGMNTDQIPTHPTPVILMSHQLDLAAELAKP